MAHLTTQNTLDSAPMKKAALKGNLFYGMEVLIEDVSSLVVKT